jgi:hypothetical protein
MMKEEIAYRFHDGGPNRVIFASSKEPRPRRRGPLEGSALAAAPAGLRGLLSRLLAGLLIPVLLAAPTRLLVLLTGFVVLLPTLVLLLVRVVHSLNSKGTIANTTSVARGDRSLPRKSLERGTIAKSAEEPSSQADVLLIEWVRKFGDRHRWPVNRRST